MAEDPLAQSYDIIVIGAGPAGSNAARAAAQKGVRVLLIDQRQRIGVPVQCAEFVPRWISRCADFSSACILQSVETMMTHLPDGTSQEMKSPGFVLDRSLFDKELVTSAILSGARISIETRAVGRSSEGVIVQHGTEQRLIRSNAIIGADGVHSSAAHWMGQPSLKSVVGLQCEIVMSKPQTHVDIFFHRDYEGGYAWFFPKGRTANVGLGAVPSKASYLSGLLNDFLKHLKETNKISRIEILSMTGGSIPCEPRQQTLFENTLLVGDAAGHAHPISGAGILTAVMGGEIAGRVAAEATVRKDPEYLRNYEIEWQEAFGNSLSYGLLKRQFLEEKWNDPEVDFGNLIRKTWVGFKDYYEDRKKQTLRAKALKYKSGGFESQPFRADFREGVTHGPENKS